MALGAGDTRLEHLPLALGHSVAVFGVDLRFGEGRAREARALAPFRLRPFSARTCVWGAEEGAREWRGAWRGSAWPSGPVMAAQDLPLALGHRVTVLRVDV